ncbi:N-succinylarginine dihydrolase [Escherichia coli]
MLGDEGAANHNRLGGHYGEPGMQLFVYGREEGNDTRPSRYPARQTREASEAVARLRSGESPTGDFRPAKPGRYRPGRFS